MAGSKYLLGVDLAQTSDYTAFIVVQRTPVFTGKRQDVIIQGHVFEEQITEDAFAVRLIERAPLHTSYVDIVTRIEDIISKSDDEIEVVVDKTGVGRPVCDLLRDRDISHTGIVITGGRSVTFDGEGWHVPKRDLVGAVQMLLQTKRLKIASGILEAALLEKELRAFKAKISKAGNDSYEAWREKDHDDLVLALALAVWRGLQSGVKHRASPIIPEYGSADWCEVEKERMLRKSIRDVLKDDEDF